MRGDYLFYEEKIETTPEEKAAKAARRYVTCVYCNTTIPIFVGMRDAGRAGR